MSVQEIISYDHTSESKRQYIGSGTYTQRGRAGDTAGVSGTGRIFVGNSSGRMIFAETIGNVDEEIVRNI